MINKTENYKCSKWLDTVQAAKYINYSKDSVDKMCQNGTFIEGIHFYKKNRKRIFSISKLDEWITSSDILLENHNNLIIDDILKDL